MALSHLRHAPLALRLALPSIACSSPATRRLLLFAPARPWRLLSTASKPRSLATSAAAEADNTSVGTDGFFAEDSTSWKSLGISDRLASALHGTGLERPSLVQVTLVAPRRCRSLHSACSTKCLSPRCNVFIYLFSVSFSVGRSNLLYVSSSTVAV
ncbi:unnamed protein product [Triticum turgidum subsp. durum]|uniref:DEAD-box RNA helicase Q domain-containing protein n=1 Tax=Triticum turgidum subsp. durum TaxID=4567 RepID=A0A9R1ALC2_TRITD|nr:unnamed protein product [Triticum turgidum subsp. durum]